MQPKIYLGFVDDWEVRGNGSGDPRVLQFEPMKRLVSIFHRYGIKASFNVEVMQQLAYRKYEEQYPDLKPIADEWEKVVLGTYAQGHDIQPHIHTQWTQARYLGNMNWQVSGDWSILNYSADEVRAILADAVTYLHSVIARLNPEYKCTWFRSGSWCIAPSPHMLSILVELGFMFDMSIVGGVYFDTPHVRLDYRNIEEDFVPYYPLMDDARRVSGRMENIVSIPTNSFHASPTLLFRRDASRAFDKLKAKLSVRARKTRQCRGVSGDEWTNKSAKSFSGKARFFLERYTRGAHLVSDIAHLNYPLLLAMLDSIRERATRMGIAHVPIILENHTKDIEDFSDIERFVAHIAQAPDVNCITLSEMANKFDDGTFSIRRTA